MWAFCTLLIFLAPKRSPSIKGKTLSLQIGFSAGGHDLFGRTLTRHICRHILGDPEVIALNMPSAVVHTHPVHTVVVSSLVKPLLPRSADATIFAEIKIMIR